MCPNWKEKFQDIASSEITASLNIMGLSRMPREQVTSTPSFRCQEQQWFSVICLKINSDSDFCLERKLFYSSVKAQKHRALKANCDTNMCWSYGWCLPHLSPGFRAFAFVHPWKMNLQVVVQNLPGCASWGAPEDCKADCGVYCMWGVVTGWWGLKKTFLDNLSLNKAWILFLALHSPLSSGVHFHVRF